MNFVSRNPCQADSTLLPPALGASRHGHVVRFHRHWIDSDARPSWPAPAPRREYRTSVKALCPGRNGACPRQESQPVLRYSWRRIRTGKRPDGTEPNSRADRMMCRSARRAPRYASGGGGPPQWGQCGASRPVLPVSCRRDSRVSLRKEYCCPPAARPFPAQESRRACSAKPAARIPAGSATIAIPIREMNPASTFPGRPCVLLRRQVPR